MFKISDWYNCNHSWTNFNARGGKSPSISSPVLILTAPIYSPYNAWICGGLCSLVLCINFIISFTTFYGMIIDTIIITNTNIS